MNLLILLALYQEAKYQEAEGILSNLLNDLKEQSISGFDNIKYRASILEAQCCIKLAKDNDDEFLENLKLPCKILQREQIKVHSKIKVHSY